MVQVQSSWRRRRLALLEGTGYMARAAFIVDRVMHRFGLHGRSFVPMVTGFGCSIPGIMATRTMENERDRLATMMVIPLMSCGARLPIWMLLVPAFFAPAWRAPMLWFIYLFGVALALVVALVLRRTALRGEEAPFVMELPPYRMPTLRSIVAKMLDRSWLYLRKAGTVILAISIVMWFITDVRGGVDAFGEEDDTGRVATQLGASAQVGAYVTVAERHQLLADVDGGWLPGMAGSAIDLGEAHVGHNFQLLDNLELIQDVGIDIPTGDEDVSYSLSLGVIATFP